MKAYMSEEDYAHYEAVLKSNWSGMKALDEQILPRMFGYADA